MPTEGAKFKKDYKNYEDYKRKHTRQKQLKRAEGKQKKSELSIKQ